jgi:hypothetical protein
MVNNRIPNLIITFNPTGKRNFGRPVKRWRHPTNQAV